MSFVHCHSCHWEQDDFWSWKGYNPLRFFFKNELKWYIWPRYVGMDAPFVTHTPFTLRFGLTRKIAVSYEPNPKEIVTHSVNPCDETCMCHRRTITEHQTHSWLLLWRCVAKWAQRIHTQVWWTWSSWVTEIRKNDNKWPCCPACGANDLDID
jgi:hypothetical protein